MTRDASPASVVRIDNGIRASWADPRRPFHLEGWTYQLDESPDLFTLHATHPRRAPCIVASFGPDWRPRDVFTAAVCHRFHLVWPP